METSHAFSTVETHTAGEPTRIITDGITFSSGDKTTADYRREFEAEFDWIRRLLVKEPRGHDDMFGAVPVPTATPEADIGLFFLTNDGYLDMCGHGTIGAVTAFVELGRLPVQETITVETPAGLIETRPQVDDGSVTSVAFQNVDAFVHDSFEVTLSTGSTVDVDVVYGGNYLALVDASALECSLSRSNTQRLIELGSEIRDLVNERTRIRHPTTDEPATVDLTEFYAHEDGVDRNVTVFANGSIDRSPCGTGTSAKMALLYERGDLAVGEPYRHRSIIDTEFEGSIATARTVDDRDVVAPEIRGSAYIIARNQFYLNPDDPIVGFSLADA
ncbi:proline racemase family protein [Halovivax cerinus]|uniref:Proline racemase family protein n=1 Tax=Halovivax cerinus TaxID=1487865 RepID=A0ABD5NQC5_9EURY|nr:proline racemase family protein [Halovivax cerinus]